MSRSLGSLAVGDKSLQKQDFVATPQGVLVLDGSGSAVVSVDGGDGHMCAALASGEVRCWGWDVLGELGDDSRCKQGSSHDPILVLLSPRGGHAGRRLLNRERRVALVSDALLVDDAQQAGAADL
jgi:hypothetical protein